MLKIGDKVYPKSIYIIDGIIDAYDFEHADFDQLVEQLTNIYGVVTDYDNDCDDERIYSVAWLNKDTHEKVAIRRLKCAWWDEDDLTQYYGEFNEIFMEELIDCGVMEF